MEQLIPYSTPSEKRLAEAAAAAVVEVVVNGRTYQEAPATAGAAAASRNSTGKSMPRFSRFRQTGHRRNFLQLRSFGVLEGKSPLTMPKKDTVRLRDL